MREVNSTKRRVAIYGRVSSEHESQLSAFDNQVIWYDKEVQKHPGWELIEKYFDKGITGTQAKKRPSFLRMIKDAKQGKFDLIITREVSRFARNTLDTLKYTRELKALGIEVMFISDNISTFDKDGETRLTNMAAYAQDESRKMSERIKAGQYIARHEKKVLYGSGNILGYNRNGKTFVIDEEQAETVRIIFELYLKNNGLKVIKSELLRLGRKNSSGQVKWFESSISRVLSNPMYIGRQYQNQTYVEDYLEHKIRKNEKDNYTIIQGNFEAIISTEDFEKVQKIKEKKVVSVAGGKSRGVRTANDKWMNLLECGCGSKFQQYKWRLNKRNGDIVRGYVCRNRITNGNIKYRLEKNLPLDGVCDHKTLSDWHLELMIKDILGDIWGFRKESLIQALKLIKENFVDETLDCGTRRKKIKNEIENLKHKSSRLLDLYTDDKINKSEFVEVRNKYNKRIEYLEDELYQIVVQEDDLVKNIEAKLQNIEKKLEQLIDFEVEKLDDRLVKQFVDKVVVRSNNKFEWLLNISDISSKELFCGAINEHIKVKSAKTIEIINTKYTFAFDSVINIGRARQYRKQFNKYLIENKWVDISYSVYIR